MQTVSEKGRRKGGSRSRMLNAGRLREYAPPVVLFALTIVIWTLGVRLAGIPSFIMPEPAAIVSRFVSELATIVPAAFVTLTEAVGGFFVGGTAAVLLAILFVRFGWLEKSIYPYALASQTIPIVAIAPLMIIWFGFGRMSKVMIAALLTFFPVLVNMVAGLRTLDP